MLMHDLMMQGYGRDESAPTPGGVFVRHFVGGCGYLRSVREVFRGWVWVFCGMLGTIFGF